ncbi:unnamed protein product [Soboliphyme baturini]|uniref:OCEL domain-containing protein n=1 Tax=Soboliphyme baturini TaxID=241478 RepID=A0A183IV80_9BILA|nr:unnamed protein product [Soboliphyme baturini]
MTAPSEIFPMICAPKLPKATAFLVKLTDSSLRSLQDWQKKVASVGDGGGGGIGGNIVINGREGRICFSKNSDSFRFTISDISRDLGPQGLQEVVQQNSETGLWQLIGSVTHRMQILATDDTYQSTKRKALQAEEDAKKVSAKVLKQPKLGASKASNKIWQKINQASAATSTRPLTPVRGTSSNVNEDWPFYSAWDRQVLRRTLASKMLQSRQNVCSEGNGDVAEKLVPPEASLVDPLDNILSDRRLSRKCMKRSSANLTADTTSPKQLALDGGKTTSTNDEQKSDSGSAGLDKESSADIVKRVHTGGAGGLVAQNVRKHPKEANKQENWTMMMETEEDDHRTTVTLKDASSDERRSDMTNDWLATFPEIKTLDERKQYKDIFDCDYPVYMKTYEKLRSIAAEFEMLGKKLNGFRKGSDEYKGIERDICIKYKKFYEDVGGHQAPCQRIRYPTTVFELNAVSLLFLIIDREHVAVGSVASDTVVHPSVAVDFGNEVEEEGDGSIGSVTGPAPAAAAVAGALSRGQWPISDRRTPVIRGISSNILRSIAGPTSKLLGTKFVPNLSLAGKRQASSDYSVSVAQGASTRGHRARGRPRGGRGSGRGRGRGQHKIVRSEGVFSEGVGESLNANRNEYDPDYLDICSRAETSTILRSDFSESDESALSALFDQTGFGPAVPADGTDTFPDNKVLRPVKSEPSLELPSEFHVKPEALDNVSGIPVGQLICVHLPNILRGIIEETDVGNLTEAKERNIAEPSNKHVFESVREGFLGTLVIFRSGRMMLRVLDAGGFSKRFFLLSSVTNCVSQVCCIL